MDHGGNTIYLIVLIIIFCILVISFILLNRKKKKKKHRKVSPEIITENKKIIHSLVFPAFLLFCMWFVKFTEMSLQEDFSRYGILPGEIGGLSGIISAPLIHDDFKHLIDNSIPAFLLCFAVFYFYRELSYRIFLIIYLGTGLLVWLIGRDAYHIGASGLIYGFASFLFFSGVASGNPNLLAISLLVTFLYGSMIWGILPYDYHISWESHLMGGITGFVLAILYHKKGPEPKKYSWEDEEEDYSSESSDRDQVVK